MSASSTIPERRCKHCYDAQLGDVAADNDSYPCTLQRTEWPQRSLRRYHQALNGSKESALGELKLFDASVPRYQNIYALDVAANAQ
jgi:hypothetical protein